MTKHGLEAVALSGMALAIAVILACAAAGDEPAEFESIFDGQSLKGWDGNPKFWRVEEGAIVGQTTAENPTRGNTFLIWRGGEVADFTLRLKFRIEGGNSGIQYRSREVDRWVIAGYQADIDSANQWTGILYEERARGVLAQRGQKVHIAEDGSKHVVGSVGTRDQILQAIKPGEWNEYTVTAQGNHIVQSINGQTTAEVIDEQTDHQAMSGLLALQLHAGPPMRVQFKDIQLKRIEKKSAAHPGGPHKKIVFVAGRPSHGYGAHEHNAGCLLLAKYLRRALPDIQIDVHFNGWPQSGIRAFDGADAVVVFCDGGGGHVLIPHLEEFGQLMDQGIGLVCLHYAVEVPQGPPGDAFLRWIGGYFETNWSVNPHWEAHFSQLPEHPVTRGVQPFAIQDEWYFHMRFAPEMKGVTPILSAHPPASTMERPDGSHSGNPHVRAALARGEIQHMAWAFERPEGGRGFGFTGAHYHWNWGDDNFRKVVLNAIAWVAGIDVPAEGIESHTPSRADLEANQDYPKPEERKQTSSTPQRQDAHSPEHAVAALDVHPELEVALFAAEPMLLNPSNIDVDHRGRVWVCEIVNYRGHKDSRADGDRILILEDTDGDGRADKQTVFYQGRDIDSPHGVCVLGNQILVSAGANVLRFTDVDGDDRPDRKEVLFTGISGVQHDHGIHAFLFGPDGKLYFNFGNEGRQIRDAQGQPIIDLAGNVVRADRKPYQDGMVFRCNRDGSQFETLAWNFRNNWMVTVDSFGTLWQSDNDDDGNRGVRINWVMEFGNYGYRDELTGAGWQTERTGMHHDIAFRHWHQNDPGVVPNLLHTGAGSPTGITIYEGSQLPAVFHGQILHCDAGPSVVRCYAVTPNGAGYDAKVIPMVQGARDPWFRPSDVKVAPDGSLIVADWYDPGVGGHQMGDAERGRLFRITSRGQSGQYDVPRYDFMTPEGAAEALRSPNHAVRYLAWTALHKMGVQAESALRALWTSDQPRLRARALWLLGKIPGRGIDYVWQAAKDPDPHMRIVAIRLARQLSAAPEVRRVSNPSASVERVSNSARDGLTPLEDGLPPVKDGLRAEQDGLRAEQDGLETRLTLSGQVVRKLLDDPSPAVRRECAIALRGMPASEAADLWSRLALQHDGHDRWYLEALGIGAAGQWDALFDHWLKDVRTGWNQPAGRDIVWRSRASKTPELLAQLILDRETPAQELPRYFRALDFQTGTEKPAAIAKIAFADRLPDGPRGELLIREAFDRLQAISPDTPQQRQTLDRALMLVRGTEQYVEWVRRFRAVDRYDELLELACATKDDQLGTTALRTLLGLEEVGRIRDALAGDDERANRLVARLGRTADNRAVKPLQEIALDAQRPLELRRQAVRSLGQLRAGAEWLLAEIDRPPLSHDLREAAVAALHTASWDDIRGPAQQRFPLAAAKDHRHLPSIVDLARRHGNAERGKVVFQTAGTCAKCHVVDGQGKEVGPNLSDIGTKLSREALFESILYPSAGINHNYQTHVAVLSDGNIVTGVLISETDEVVEIKSEEAVVTRLTKADIEGRSVQPVSLMPADLHKELTEEELVDLVEYLATLKGGPTLTGG